MFDVTTLATFVVIVLGLFLIPGPAVLLVLSRTVQGGRKVGVMTGLGVATGDFVHTLFAAVGLSALLMTSALAFNVVKYVGAAYLVYLGIRAFLAKPSDPSLPTLAPISPLRAYLEAIPAEVLNPKTALFFLAFMPQFVHPEKGSSFVQFAVLAVRWLERERQPAPIEFHRLLQTVDDESDVLAAIHDLLELKRHTSEVGVSAQIVPIQRFIERELDRIEALELPINDRPEVEPLLSEFFRQVLRESWGGA